MIAESSPAESLLPDLAARLRLALQSHRVLQLPTPADFARRTGAAGSKPVALAFEDARIDGVGVLRQTRIDGPATCIVALMVFPHDARALPVFACEFVVFGGIVRAGVVDLQTLDRAGALAARVDALLAPLADRHPEWRPTEDMPEWCKPHFTAHAILATRLAVADIPRLIESFDTYARAFALLAEGAAHAPPEMEDDTLRAYKDHHIAHTPGLPYLERVFGVEWTARFLREGMYR